jgi:hypothetical protein
MVGILRIVEVCPVCFRRLVKGGVLVLEADGYKRKHKRCGPVEGRSMKSVSKDLGARSK